MAEPAKKLPAVDVTAERTGSFKSDVVQVGTFRDMAPLDVPQTSNVVTREVLDAQAATTLGSLWITREMRSGDWRGFGFGAGLFAAGEREGDLANSFRVPGYTRADASLFYRGNGWRATLGVKNLFDKEYIESPVSRTEVYPGAPRTVMATLEVKL